MAIAILERLVADQPANAEILCRLAVALRRRGVARREIGDPPGAADDTRRALETFESLPSPSNGELFDSAC